jgi:hypothetical protein
MSKHEEPYVINTRGLKFIVPLFRFESVFTDLVNEALRDDENTEIQSPVLNQILTAEGVDIRDKIVALIDLVAAGIETVYTYFKYFNNNS